MSSGDEIDLGGTMFQEPAGYFPPEPVAKYIEHTLLSGQTIKLRLVGHNPLWVPTHQTLMSSPVPTSLT